MEEKEEGLVLSNCWSNLPEEVRREILQRVPAKPLSRLKCVSKSWYHFLSTIYAPLCGFICRSGFLLQDKEYTDYVPFTGKTIRRSGEKAIPTSDSDFVKSFSTFLPFQPNYQDFLDCCNGLLLFFDKRVVPSHFFVCNPFTKQCVSVPVNPAHTRNSNVNFLAFDPSLSPDYRILRFSRVPNGRRKVDVFSSGTGKWVSSSVNVVLPEHSKMFRRPVYLNGVLYVLTTTYCLLRFDQNLNVRHYELPLRKETDLFGFIGKSNGNLFYSNNDEVNLMVWLFQETNGGADCLWILKHKIDIKGIMSLFHGILEYTHCLEFQFKPYALHPFSDVIFIGIPMLMFSYHPKTDKFKVIFTADDGTRITSGQNLLYCYTSCPIVLKDFRTANPSNCICELDSYDRKLLADSAVS